MDVKASRFVDGGSQFVVRAGSWWSGCQSERMFGSCRAGSKGVVGKREMVGCGCCTSATHLLAGDTPLSLWVWFLVLLFGRPLRPGTVQAADVLGTWDGQAGQRRTEPRRGWPCNGGGIHVLCNTVPIVEPGTFISDFQGCPSPQVTMRMDQYLMHRLIRHARSVRLSIFSFFLQCIRSTYLQPDCNSTKVDDCRSALFETPTPVDLVAKRLALICCRCCLLIYIAQSLPACLGTLSL